MDSPPFDATDTIGALVIGVIVSIMLYGISTTQTYLYFVRFPEDSNFLRLLVIFVWLCETVHAGIIGHVLYFYSVTNYGNPKSLLEKVPGTLPVSIVITGVITALVQGFFAYRIWAFSTNRIFKLISVVICLTDVAYLGASFAATILSFSVKNIQQFLRQYGWLLFGPWIVTLINDVAITGSLVVLLLRNRTKGLALTTALVDKLIKWAVETGLITSLFGVVTIIYYQKHTATFIWVGLQIIKARLFANSLLASLNSRTTLRAIASEPDPTLGTIPTGTMLSTLPSGSRNMSTVAFRGDPEFGHERTSTHDDDDVVVPQYKGI
ncbi:hypothetical protein MIND_01345500 [Mycena indigotica]|uniref:DUF6534 domain-containing protein n=1 Tax=Mycena indigotica TaxID=2126181 RepID=A0A8H6S0D5_9AGAR|nr:uncharacterized protein MIND_01345500 [Mycena indigotica]KAF7289721.1 hypothetical protein MIND_01345500 [Mycena indigotica]